MGYEGIIVFSGVGFHTWQMKVKGYLMKKGLWSLVKLGGEIETATSTTATWGATSAFASRDEKALGILLTSVADDLVHYLDKATSSRHAWDILEWTFGAKSKNSKISLRMQLYGLMMHDDETLSSLVNRLKSICTQLSYIGCNIENDNKIAILLKSLPKLYDNIVMVLKEKEPKPSLESIIKSLYEEEKKISTQESFFFYGH